MFNQSLEIEEAEKSARKKVDAWDQWMDQSGKPDCNSAPAISVSDSPFIEIGSESFKNPLEQCF